MCTTNDWYPNRKDLYKLIGKLWTLIEGRNAC